MLPTDEEGKQTTELWRVVMAGGIVPSVIIIVLGLTVFRYETPKYLHSRRTEHNNEEKLMKVLNKIYHHEDVNAVIEDLNSSSKIASSKVTMKEALCSKEYACPTYIGIFLYFIQQFSGINAVMMFSSWIFEESGIDP